MLKAQEKNGELSHLLETMKIFDYMDEKNFNLYNDKICKALLADKLVDPGLRRFI